MPAAIHIHRLGKRYRLDPSRGVKNYGTLRESLTRVAAAPIRWLRPSASTSTSRDFWALKDVSFEVARGDVVGIIGRNGAGKSTLLKILSRITRPTAGRMELRGRVGSLLEVGTGFHPELTGRENIFLNGAILGMSRREIRRNFDAIVAFAEIDPFLDTPVKRYSSGMYIRLAFAVASHLEPEILVVDEVLAVGDTRFQKKCLGRMGAVAREGRTVLFVSHNLGAITGLCRTAAWLDSGCVRALGPVRSVVDAYIRAGTDRASETVDLSRHAGRTTSGSLKIDRLQWRSGLPLTHGEPARIRLHAQVLKEIDDVSFGVGFSTPEGTRLLTYDTDFAGPRLALAADTEIAVEVQVPALPLNPGLYALDVGARSGDAFPLDYLPACVLVEVAPGPNTPAQLTRFGGCGVRLHADWSTSLQAA
jgi:lipopolysaccharide transport system ATP-binding protein